MQILLYILAGLGALFLLFVAVLLIPDDRDYLDHFRGEIP